MSEAKFGYVYDYATATRLREAKSEELAKSLHAFADSAGVFEDEDGRRVYVADEDSSTHEAAMALP